MNHDNPYLDFTDNEELINAFEPGSNTEKWLNDLAHDVQRALNRRNPNMGVKHLLAGSLIGNASSNIEIVRTLKHIRIILLGIFIILIIMVSKGVL